MEIKNDLVMCAKNHYFNASVHSACPICGGPAVSAGHTGSFVPTEKPDMGGASASFIPTEAPTGGAGSFIPTEAPTGAGASGFSSPGATAPADSWNAPGGAVNPFSSQTVIGGDIAAAGQVDPVVGWVVCIDGPLRGTDWRLHVGYNYIGRELGDIHIQGDSQISREKHAMIAYHNKNRTYYVGPAEGRNIIELNDEPVFNATKLSRHDVITVGTTKLMFIPLCDETFAWDQEKQEKNDA